MDASPDSSLTWAATEVGRWTWSRSAPPRRASRAAGRRTAASPSSHLLTPYCTKWGASTGGISTRGGSGAWVAGRTATRSARRGAGARRSCARGWQTGGSRPWNEQSGHASSDLAATDEQRSRSAVAPRSLGTGRFVEKNPNLGKMTCFGGGRTGHSLLLGSVFDETEGCDRTEVSDEILETSFGVTRRMVIQP